MCARWQQTGERKREKKGEGTHIIIFHWVAAAVYFQCEKFPASHCHVARDPCSAGQPSASVGSQFWKENNELLLGSNCEFMANCCLALPALHILNK